MGLNYQKINNLKVSSKLISFVNNELLEGLDIPLDEFWVNFDKAVHELSPRNKELINIRADLQKKIDAWHIEKKIVKLRLKIIKHF